MTTRIDDGPQGYCGFVVGQHVVCVKAPTYNNVRSHIAKRYISELFCPTVGVVYTVRAVKFTPKGSPYLLLVEILNAVQKFNDVGAAEIGFRAHNFRPLPKLKVEDFLSTETPVDGGKVPA